MAKKHHNPPGGPQTGNEFVELAKRRGASITKSKSSMFISVETPSGKVHINPSDAKLDVQTVKNLRRWFKLLGLMILFVLAIARLLVGF